MAGSLFSRVLPVRHDPGAFSGGFSGVHKIPLRQAIPPWLMQSNQNDLEVRSDPVFSGVSSLDQPGCDTTVRLGKTDGYRVDVSMTDFAEEMRFRMRLLDEEDARWEDPAEQEPETWVESGRTVEQQEVNGVLIERIRTVTFDRPGQPPITLAFNHPPVQSS